MKWKVSFQCPILNVDSIVKIQLEYLQELERRREQEEKDKRLAEQLMKEMENPLVKKEEVLDDRVLAEIFQREVHVIKS